MDTKLYEQCKRKVKLWEKNFRKEKGRIPSKHDFQEADRAVRDAYRTYGRLKTAHLAKELADVFTDDDSTQYSQISQISEVTTSPPSQGFFSAQSLDEESCHDENQATFNRLNQEAWNLVQSPKKPEIVEELKEEVPKQPRLRMNKNFTLRNPRKSLSKRRSSIATTSSSSLSSPPEETLPDLETILLEKSRRCQEVTRKPTETRLLNNVDADWLSRRDPSLGMVSNATRPSSYGLSNLNLMTLSQNSTPATPNAIATCESDDSIVANSEDESTILQSSQSRRSIRHVIKKQRVEESITETPAASPAPSPVPSPSETKQKSKKTKKVKAAPPKKQPDRPLRRSARKTNVSEPMYDDTMEPSEDEDLFGDADDDDDPLYKEEEPQDQPKKVTKPKAVKTVKKPARKVAKAPKKVAKAAKKEVEMPPPSDDYEKSQEFTDYVLEFGIERLENVPRINAAELEKSETLVGRFVLGETEPSTTVVTKVKKPAAVNADRAKLEKKIAAGSLNENYRTINIQKKKFVRGKKTFNFSRYKKSQWKQKKAAALSGPEMDMGGCDGGLLTCFQCGGVGHMARQCKAKGDGLLPLDADGDDDSQFPTLDEAKQMVDNQKLLAHARNLSNLPANTQHQTEDDSDIEMADAVLIPAPIRHKVPEDFLQKTGFLDRTAGKDIVEPLYPAGVDTPQEVYDALKLFGHETFRDGQEQAIMRILSGKSTLVTLSTGSGKSLCYQLPAYLYKKHRKCITLVISPLVSLMEDQVLGVPKFLHAQCLHTNQTDKQREKIMLLVKEEKIDVLLVSPEAVVAGEKATGFGALLRRLPPIAFVCIDEAHCVSQWSHNFRPSYLSICRVLKEKLNVKTILGLTATATKSTRLSIVEHIGVPDGEEGIISDIPMPDNLLLTVSKDRDRDMALIELIKSDRFTDCNSIIVYCTRREECERVASVIRTTLQSFLVPAESSKRKRFNWIAEPYHAGMAASRRRTIQNAFMSGDLRIVVATVAFGMGINKSNIRAVIHYNMPKSFESYVQEIGRAGRDGKQAHCHVFLDARGGDRNELRRHIYSNSIDRHVIRKLLQKIFVPCACGGNSQERQQLNSRKCPGHEVCFSIEETVQLLDIPEENIATLLCYLELHDQRYIQVLSRAYTKCKIFSYGGVKDFRNAAKNCPPLAMAIALDLKRGVTHEASNSIEFNVVDIASAIGWDSGVVKYQLKQLEWTTVDGRPRRSRITVQFSDLGFRVRAPGDMTDEALDESLELLHRRVSQQEKAELLQLQTVFNALSDAAFNSYLRAAERECSNEPSEKLKTTIREYFATELVNVDELEPDVEDTPDEQLINDIRIMIQRYPENNFNGRALARIFHGVASPNYPAVIWGRCKYWRVHMDADFNRIVRLANAELVRMRL